MGGVMKVKIQYTEEDAIKRGMEKSHDKHCPECGNPWYGNKNMCGEGFRVCYVCHQDWWVDIDYKNSAERRELPAKQNQGVSDE